MPLAPSTRLGPYEILAPLGAGAWARCTGPAIRAIKISAERFSDRFEREVRAVAALNRPNICQIYDVGPNYLVMELVEGPTLGNPDLKSELELLGVSLSHAVMPDPGRVLLEPLRIALASFFYGGL